MKDTLENLMELLCAILIFGLFWLMLAFGSVIEDEIRCRNGAIDFCYAEKVEVSVNK